MVLTVSRNADTPVVMAAQQTGAGLSGKECRAPQRWGALVDIIGTLVTLAYFDLKFAPTVTLNNVTHQ